MGKWLPLVLTAIGFALRLSVSDPDSLRLPFRARIGYACYGAAIAYSLTLL